MRALHVWWMKRRARSLLRQIHAMYDQYDGGAGLMNMVTGGRLHNLKTALAETMEELKQIDPKYSK